MNNEPKAFEILGAVVFVIVVILFTVLIFAGGVYFTHPGYRDGVIDAQAGRARVELIENPDGTTEWGPVIRTEVTP